MNQIPATTAIKQKEFVDNYEKGQAFEAYVIQLFAAHNFHLKKWRKAEDRLDLSTLIDHANPDLEIELVFTGNKRYRFAVECKWRQEFKDGKITWADDNKIVNYRKFQDIVRVPVFVAIGIGGAPSSPDKLFVTPLNNIWMYNELYESDLIPYKRRPTRNFYYDAIQLKLF